MKYLILNLDSNEAKMHKDYLEVDYESFEAIIVEKQCDVNVGDGVNIGDLVNVRDLVNMEYGWI